MVAVSGAVVLHAPAMGGRGAGGGKPRHLNAPDCVLRGTTAPLAVPQQRSKGVGQQRPTALPARQSRCQCLWGFTVLAAGEHWDPLMLLLGRLSSLAFYQALHAALTRSKKVTCRCGPH